LLERDVEEPIPLSGATARATELFYPMSDGLFHELGIRLPPIVLVADDTLPARCCRICIDDAPGPLLALIALDTVLVNVPREDLEREKIAARRARNPNTLHLMIRIAFSMSIGLRGLA
ncbi:MAG TPA: hypothetical protein VGT81_06035, partial [Casimicrobiaceae bacterium]|nr:hypothetical protein [Casimicrobiaceae bacterium]